MRRVVSAVAIGIAFLIVEIPFPDLTGDHKDGALAPASTSVPALDGSSKEAGYLD